MKAELITQSEYARRRGVRPSAVTRAVKAGRILLIDGKVDPAVADVQWAANSRVRSGSRPAASWRAAGTMQTPVHDDAGEPSYLASRARREAAEASLAELRLAEQAGQLVSVEEVRAAFAPRLAAAREIGLGLAARLAPIVAAETDAGRVHELLDAELRRALEEMAGAATDLSSIRCVDAKR